MEEVSFEARLSALRDKANAALSAALCDLSGDDGKAPEVLVEAMRYAVLGGGKRLRPVLALAACEAVCGEPDRALPVAVALEMIHAYSLVHDDLPCMDDDDERRGKPTVHIKYGEPRAILTGDALLTEAFSVLSEPSWSVPAASRLRIVALVAGAAGATGMVGGQEYDMASAKGELPLPLVEQLHAMKTGALFRAAVVGGGLAAGADEAQLALLDRYGRCLGKAFQLTDDLLDLREAGAEATTTGDPHEDAVNLAVRLGPEACQAQASARVAEAIEAAQAFSEAGAVLAGVAALIERRRA